MVRWPEAPESVRGGTFRRSFGDEWNRASERGSIQPRVPLSGLEDFGAGVGGLEVNNGSKKEKSYTESTEE